MQNIYTVQNLIYKIRNKTVVSRMSLKDIHTQIPRTWQYVILHDKRDFADIIKVADFKIGRLFWIAWMGPIQSYEFLKAENFLQLGAEKMQQKRELKRFFCIYWDDH